MLNILIFFTALFALCSVSHSEGNSLGETDKSEINKSVGVEEAHQKVELHFSEEVQLTRLGVPKVVWTYWNK